jgi:hypothetical protein
MGVDLVLLPFDADSDIIAFSHTILNCFRRQDLFSVIMDIEDQHGTPVPKGFSSFVSREGEDCEEPHYGETTTTPYGETLNWVFVNKLSELAEHPDVKDNHKNIAIWAYLKCLPDNTKIALYWH